MKISELTTSILLHLGNDTLHVYGYHEPLIGSRVWSIELCMGYHD